MRGKKVSPLVALLFGFAGLIVSAQEIPKNLVPIAEAE